MEHLPSAQRPVLSMAAGQKFFFGPHRVALSVGECAALRGETLVAASAQDPTARNANEQRYPNYCYSLSHSGLAGDGVSSVAARIAGSPCCWARALTGPSSTGRE